MEVELGLERGMEAKVEMDMKVDMEVEMEMEQGMEMGMDIGGGDGDEEKVVASTHSSQFHSRGFLVVFLTSETSQSFDK